MTAATNRGIYRKFQVDAHNKPFMTIVHNRDYFDVNTPYQRGHVWGVSRQRKLIESLIMGIPIAGIVINERPTVYDRVFVVDGKQRLTAMWDFIDGRFGIPAEWIGDLAEGATGELHYPDCPDLAKRVLGNFSVAFIRTTLTTLAEEEDLFDRLNFGGVPQGESDFTA